MKAWRQKGAIAFVSSRGVRYAVQDAHEAGAGEELAAAEMGYEAWGDGLAVVSGEGAQGAVVVPQCHNGLPVLCIGNAAFKGNRRIESVTLPEGLQVIDRQAFRYCERLSAVLLPDSLREVGERAFEDCEALQKLFVMEAQVGRNAFDGCSSLTVQTCEGSQAEQRAREAGVAVRLVRFSPAQDFVCRVDEYGAAIKRWRGQEAEVHVPRRLLGQDVTSLADYAFEDRRGLISVTLPDCLKRIGNYAFSGCHDLRLVVIPAGVTQISDYAFHKCRDLKLVVEADSPAQQYAQRLGLSWTVAGDEPETVQEIPEAGMLPGEERTAERMTAKDAKPSAPEQTAAHAAPASREDKEDAKPAAAPEADFRLQAVDSIPGACRLVEYTGDQTHVTVPATVQGQKVLTILESCFAGKMLKHVTLPEGVEFLDTYAFRDCVALESVVLPATIGEVKSGTFMGCTALREVQLAAGNIEAYTFAGCVSLTRVEGRDGLTHIRSYAFRNCSALQTVQLPASVTDIAEDAFAGCQQVVIHAPEGSAAYEYARRHGLLPTELPLGGTQNDADSLTDWKTGDENGLSFRRDENGVSVTGYTGTQEQVEIPASYAGVPVVAIGKKAFRRCAHLTSVVVPEGVRTLGDSAFARCGKLENVQLPATLEHIGEDAFNRCEALRSVRIPSGVKKLSASAFDGCTALEQVELPEGLTELGSCAFQNCGAIRKLQLPRSLRHIGQSALRECSALTELSIPDGVEELEPYALTRCFGLTSLTLGAGLQVLDRSVLRDCTGLRSLRIPAGVKELRAAALYGCTRLQELTLPEGMQKIGELALGSCGQLKELRLPAGVTEVHPSALSGCKDVKVILTAESPMEEALQAMGVTVERAKEPESVPEAQPEQTQEQKETISLALMDEACFKTGVANLPDGECRVLEYWGEAEDAAIPAVIRGERVVEISRSETHTYDRFRHLQLPEGLRAINEYAFRRCRELCSVQLPGTLESIGSFGFFSCEALETIRLPEGLKKMGMYAFFGCKALREIRIPGSVEQLEDSVLGSCSSLETVEILPGVKRIGRAFRDCAALARVIIPATVTELDERAFQGCSGVTIAAMEGSCAHQYAQAHGLNWENTGATPVQTVHQVEEIPARTSAPDAQPAEPAVPDSQPAEENPFTPESELTTSTDPRNEGCCMVTDYRGASPHLRIPPVIGGKRVTTLKGGDLEERNLESVTLPEGVTAIGNRALQDCSGLRYIELPSTLMEIGNFAFHSCRKLEQLELPAGLTRMGMYAFYGCCALTQVVIPGGLEQLEDSLFSSCTALKEVKILPGVKRIGRTFRDCPELRRVTIPATVTEISEAAFRGCGDVTIVAPEGSAAIDYARANGLKCEMLQSAAPASHLTVQETDESLFRTGTDGLGEGECYVAEYWGKEQEVSVPAMIRQNRVVELHSSVSYRSIRSIRLPEGLRRIGVDGFRYCDKLELAVLPSTLRVIDEHAFSGCEQLEITPLPAALEEIGSFAFHSCKQLEQLALPHGLRKIGMYAFYGCRALTKMTIPGSVEALEDLLFSNCPQLAEVVIEPGVKRIGRTFRNCTGLKTVQIPSTVTQIHPDAFRGCDNLTLKVEAGSAADRYAREHGLKAEGGAASTPRAEDQPPAAPTLHQADEEITMVHLLMANEERDFETGTGNMPQGECRVLRYKGEGDRMIIPESIRDRRVVEIEGSSSYKVLRELRLPEGLRRIHERTFRACEKLETAVLPSTLEEIGAFAFFDCEALERLSLPAGLKKVGKYAFSTSGLVEIRIPGGVKELPEAMFRDCQKLKSAVLEEGVTAIGRGAFWNCPALQTVRIPATVEAIHEMAFLNSPQVQLMVRDGSFAHRFAQEHGLHHSFA